MKGGGPSRVRGTAKRGRPARSTSSGGDDEQPVVLEPEIVDDDESEERDEAAEPRLLELGEDDGPALVGGDEDAGGPAELEPACGPEAASGSLVPSDKIGRAHV